MKHRVGSSTLNYRSTLWALITVSSACATLSACEDTFSGDNCAESRTCAPAAGGEAAGGSDDSVAGGADANQGGAGANTSEACVSDESCSNDDPEDGIETCSDAGACEAGNPPPVVLSVTPEHEAQDVEPDAAIVIEFSEPLDPASVTADTVQLLQGDSVIEGELAYTGTTVSFVPNQPLALLAPYTVSVSTSVTDVEGGGLLEAFSSELVTRDGSWKVTTAVQGSIFQLGRGLPMDDDGDVLVSWIKRGTSVYCPTTARTFRRGTSMSSEKELTGELPDCSQAAAAGNAAGDFVVAWEDNFTGFWAMQERKGWSPEKVKVSGISGYGMNVGVAPDGTMHLTRSDAGGAVAWHATPQGTWLPTGDPMSEDAGESAAQMAFDMEGNGFAAWRAQDNTTQREKIVVSRYTASLGKWSAAVSVPESQATNAGPNWERGAPAVAVDAGGEAMLVWVAESSAGVRIFYSRFDKATGWGQARPLSSGGGGTSAFLSEPPGLVFDGETFVAAWTLRVSSLHNTYAARYDFAADQWADELVSDGVTSGAARMPRLGGDARQNLLLIWARRTTNAAVYDLMFRRFTAASGEWSEAKAIPEGQIDDATLEGSDYSKFSFSVNANGLGAAVWANKGATGYYDAIRLASFH